MSKNNYYINLISFIIFSIPFLDFIFFNIREINLILSTSFLLLTIFIFLIILFVSLIMNTFSNTKNFNHKILISSIIFWLLFQHNALKSFINNLFNKKEFVTDYSSEFTLFLLVLFSIISSLLISKKSLLFIRFVSIYFCISFSIISFQIISYEQNKILLKDFTDDTHNYVIDNKKNIKRSNIYYIILDSMKPVKDYERYYQIDLSNFLVNAKDRGYKYFENSESLFDNTTETLTSFFNLKNVSLEQVNKPFPAIMRSKYNPPLIYLLDQLEYGFKWTGNMYAYCPTYNLNYCLDNSQSSFIDFYLYINFLKQSPFTQIFTKVAVFFGWDFNKHVIYKLHNGMGRLAKYLTLHPEMKEKPNFYFIHHTSPHYPYVTNKDCSFSFTPGKADLVGYEKAYMCDLKRINETISFLEKFDPDSFVIFQADHNWKLSENHEEVSRRIFNLIKYNKECPFDKKIKYHHLNTLEWIFSCITNNEPNYSTD